MCGIALVINPDKNPFFVNRDYLFRMAETLSKRGIRDKFITDWTNKDAVLIHSRLPIQGLSRKFDHPYTKGNLSVAFVGEFLNYKKFYSSAQSDCQTLLKLFEEKCYYCYDEFDGFWSSIVSDFNNKLFYVSLDPLGKKPLYIRQHGEMVAIASDILSLIDVGPVTDDELYYSAVGKWRYFIGDRTPWNEIKKLEPDRTYIFSSSGQLLNIHYHNSFSRKPSSNNFDHLLDTAIKNRLVSDVPVSVLLSGGLDSTIIYYKLLEQNIPINCIHISNGEDSSYLEYLNFPQRVKLTTLEVTQEYIDYMIKEYLCRILFTNQTPVDLGSVIPQFLMSEKLKEQGCHVAISGDGADEIFGGYKRSLIYDSQYSDIFQELVYYHLPRLDRLTAPFLIELRSPFLNTDIINYGLRLPYRYRQNKLFLKEMYRHTIPTEVLHRKKEPLKIEQVRNDKQSWTLKLIDLFRSITP